MTLTSQQRETLNLIARSTSDAEGWGTCSSGIFWHLVAKMPTALVETDPDTLRCRLTDEAKSVLKWL